MLRSLCLLLFKSASVCSVYSVVEKHFFGCGHAAMDSFVLLRATPAKRVVKILISEVRSQRSEDRRQEGSDPGTVFRPEHHYPLYRTRLVRHCRQRDQKPNKITIFLLPPPRSSAILLTYSTGCLLPICPAVIGAIDAKRPALPNAAFPLPLATP